MLGKSYLPGLYDTKSIIACVSRVPLRLIFAVVAAALSLILLTWSLSPPGRVAHTQPIQPTQMQLPTPIGVATQSAIAPGPLAVPERRQLNIDFPPVIRFGEAERVHMTFDVDAVAQTAGVQNVYETYNVLAEARLDMAGMEVRPQDIVSEPLLPGQRATFFWSLRPSEVGRLKGTVWFYLRFVPKNGGPERRQAISAQVIEIESTALFGLQAEAARWLGLVGVFIGSLLSFPFFIDALKWLWKKMRRVV